MISRTCQRCKEVRRCKMHVVEGKVVYLCDRCAPDQKVGSAMSVALVAGLLAISALTGGCALWARREPFVEVWTRGTHPVCKGAGDPDRSDNVLLLCEDGLEVRAPWSRVERTGPRSGVVDLP